MGEGAMFFPSLRLHTWCRMNMRILRQFQYVSPFPNPLDDFERSKEPSR